MTISIGRVNTNLSMDIGELISEADQCLREADPLCSDANAFYAESRLLVEQSTISWSRIMFSHAAQQDQLQSMGNICLVIKSAVDKSQHECQHKIKSMRRSRSDLRNLLVSSKSTTLDKAFVMEGHLNDPNRDPSKSPNKNAHDDLHTETSTGPSIELGNESNNEENENKKESGYSLYQFVHEDDIAALNAKVDELSDQLQRQFASLEHIPTSVQAQLGDLRTHIPNVQEGVMKSEIPRKLARMTTKSAPFASQMADLLVSLTSHYDLCSQIPQLSPEDAQEATQVALGDRTQVLEAVKQSKESRSQSKSRHRESQRIQNSLDVAFEQSKVFEDELNRFLRDSLHPALTEVQATHSACRESFKEIAAVTNELTSLAEYYRLFRKSYHALIVEIARRHESAKQFRKVIENANNAVSGFQKRETEVRNGFLTTYQEFLPPELSTGLTDMPREYAIKIEPELLPESSKTTLLTAMKEHQ